MTAEPSAVWGVPKGEAPGLRLDLQAMKDAQVRLRRIEVRRTGGLAWALAASVGVAVGLVSFLLLVRLGGPLSVALALFVSTACSLATTPLLLVWTVAGPGSWARVVLPGVSLLASLALTARCRLGRRYFFGVALTIAAVAGLWVRLYFLPSAGAWDVEYWKACALRASEHGVTRVYGNPETVPPGHFLAQLHGREPAWELESFGNRFVVDQPPGIQTLWAVSWWLVPRLAPWLSRSEGLNVAAKLPATLGDLLAVGVLLLAFRSRLRLGGTLAALYWALPISWLSSSVLGFFDGAAAAVAVASVVAAGRGKPTLAGTLMALAALVKSTSLLMGPAVLVALWLSRAKVARGLGAGAAVLALAMVPFLVEGTFEAAAVHMYRIVFQERLSGGFANAWWLASAALAPEGHRWSDPTPYVHIDTVTLPVRAIGTGAMALLVAFLMWNHRHAPGPRAAALAGFTLVFGYGMVAVGVHENHPHALALALLATGLGSVRLRVLATAVLTSYSLNMLALSGIGRFYGPRYMAIEPLGRAVGGLRQALGFDLTLVLAVVNIAAFGLLLIGLGRELKRLGASG